MLTSDRPAVSLPTFPVLVVDDNPDQRLLFSYSLKERLPQVQATFRSCAAGALSYLATTCAQQPRQFPRLVLLDLYLPELWQGWQVLTEIRARYPRLPVVVLTHSPRQELVDKSYDLGVHSFLAKPTSLEGWGQQFAELGQYWLGTVTLPTPC